MQATAHRRSGRSGAAAPRSGSRRASLPPLQRAYSRWPIRSTARSRSRREGVHNGGWFPGSHARPGRRLALAQLPRRSGSCRRCSAGYGAKGHPAGPGFRTWPAATGRRGASLDRAALEGSRPPCRRAGDSVQSKPAVNNGKGAPGLVHGPNSLNATYIRPGRMSDRPRKLVKDLRNGHIGHVPFLRVRRRGARCSALGGPAIAAPAAPGGRCQAIRRSGIIEPYGRPSWT